MDFPGKKVPFMEPVKQAIYTYAYMYACLYMCNMILTNFC